MDQVHIDYSQTLRRNDPVLTRARASRKDVIAVHGERGGLEYRSLDDPLDFYVGTRKINDRQYDAGNRLRSLSEQSAKSPFSQVAYGEERGGTALEYFPIGVFAVEYRNAVGSVRGEKERIVVQRVCCAHVSASRAIPFKSRRTAERKGIRYLISALDDLADHFKC